MQCDIGLQARRLLQGGSIGDKNTPSAKTSSHS
jgi:hypothetical protein